MSDGRFLRQNPNPVPLDVLHTPDFDVREYRTDADIENIREDPPVPEHVPTFL
jgi:hypothetical protein